MPVIQKLIGVYKLWHEFLRHFPKTSRYTLGSKIDALFVEVTELVIIASYLSRKEKMPLLRQGVTKLDLLKFFLRVAWEIKALDNKKYIALSEYLDEVGKMLGGWIKHLSKETPSF